MMQRSCGLEGEHVSQLWWFEVQIESKNEVSFCTNNMTLMFLDDNVLFESIPLQMENHKFFGVYVKAKLFLLKNDSCLQNKEAYFKVIISKIEFIQWTGDFLITSWFYKFVLYVFSWMMYYLMGSQPWHVANKWCTCNLHYLWIIVTLTIEGFSCRYPHMEPSES